MVWSVGKRGGVRRQSRVVVLRERLARLIRINQTSAHTWSLQSIANGSFSMCAPMLPNSEYPALAMVLYNRLAFWSMTTS